MQRARANEIANIAMCIPISPSSLSFLRKLINKMIKRLLRSNSRLIAVRGLPAQFTAILGFRTFDPNLTKMESIHVQHSGESARAIITLKKGVAFNEFIRTISASEGGKKLHVEELKGEMLGDKKQSILRIKISNLPEQATEELVHKLVEQMAPPIGIEIIPDSSKKQSSAIVSINSADFSKKILLSLSKTQIMKNKLRATLLSSKAVAQSEDTANENENQLTLPSYFQEFLARKEEIISSYKSSCQSKESRL